jgi:hypothetical protein
VGPRYTPRPVMTQRGMPNEINSGQRAPSRVTCEDGLVFVQATERSLQRVQMEAGKLGSSLRTVEDGEPSSAKITAPGTKPFPITTGNC